MSRCAAAAAHVGRYRPAALAQQQLGLVHWGVPQPRPSYKDCLACLCCEVRRLDFAHGPSVLPPLCRYVGCSRQAALLPSLASAAARQRAAAAEGQRAVLLGEWPRVAAAAVRWWHVAVACTSRTPLPSTNQAPALPFLMQAAHTHLPAVVCHAALQSACKPSSLPCRLRCRCRSTASACWRCMQACWRCWAAPLRRRPLSRSSRWGGLDCLGVWLLAVPGRPHCGADL